ncbi:MAG: hypothetical protein KKA64_04560 [Nanoarchaeota archaeon]|nr:hypothetical protein [Nanoarchaeota archaeon]
MSEPRTKEREKELKKFIDSAKNKGQGFLKNALEWFKLNVGTKVISEELAQIPGKKGKSISHNIRRIFELRDEQGYELINHNDNVSSGKKLKVDEWILVKKEPNPKNIRSRGVNKRIMYEVFTRDDNMCQFCGRKPGDDDPFKPGHKIKLHVGHIIAHKRTYDKEVVRVERIDDMNSKAILTKEDFITMCNVCNEGAKNKDLEIMTPVAKVMKLRETDQKEIYSILKKKFS